MLLCGVKSNKIQNQKDLFLFLNWSVVPKSKEKTDSKPNSASSQKQVKMG